MYVSSCLLIIDYFDQKFKESRIEAGEAGLFINGLQVQLDSLDAFRYVIWNCWGKTARWKDIDKIIFVDWVLGLEHESPLGSLLYAYVHHASSKNLWETVF